MLSASTFDNELETPLMIDAPNAIPLPSSSGSRCSSWHCCSSKVAALLWIVLTLLLADEFSYMGYYQGYASVGLFVVTAMYYHHCSGVERSHWSLLPEGVADAILLAGLFNQVPVGLVMLWCSIAVMIVLLIIQPWTWNNNDQQDHEQGFLSLSEESDNQEGGLDVCQTV